MAKNLFCMKAGVQEENSRWFIRTAKVDNHTSWRATAISPLSCEGSHGRDWFQKTDKYYSYEF